MHRFNLLRRILIMFFVVSFLFLLLGAKIFWIQVVKGPGLARMAVQQRAQGLAVLSGRGDIQDRHGHSLLDRDRWVGLAAFPAQYSGREQEIAGQYAAVPGIERIFLPPPDLSPFWVNPCVEQSILPDLSAGIPGIITYPAACRYGPGVLASHTIGYLKESEGRGVSGIEL
ncbi:MAG TPA: hypothetical protein GX693_03750, partial [Firmicutes bacterium]|nr:hypothetical protein [Bacillota bacterium]